MNGYVNVDVEWKKCVGASFVWIEVYEVTWPQPAPAPASYALVGTWSIAANAADGTGGHMFDRIKKPYGTYFSVEVTVQDGFFGTLATYTSPPSQ